MEKDFLASKGVHLYGNAQFLPSQEKRVAIAMDAAIPLITSANVSIPQMFTTWVDPKVVEILTAPTSASEVFPEAKVADWKDTQTTFPVVEKVGRTEAYSDFGKGTTSDANFEFPVRDVYRMQTVIQCGDLEQEMTAAAKINLLSQKQQAAALTLQLDRNEMELFGLAGKSIYGLLNDPNLPAAISPSTANGKTGWAQKGAVGVYNDILAMFAQLAKQSAGLITFDTPMVLAIPPSINAALAQVTDLGVAPVLEMIKAHFPNLRIVTIAQLEDETGVDKAILVAEEVRGQKVAQLGFADLLRTSRVIQDYTSISQKWMSSTCGAMIYLPVAFASMTGIQATA